MVHENGITNYGTDDSARTKSSYKLLAYSVTRIEIYWSIANVKFCSKKIILTYIDFYINF